MSDSIAKDIYQKLLEETESFELYGEEIAYLLGQIISDDKFQVTEDDYSSIEFYVFLKRIFPVKNPIQYYLEIGEIGEAVEIFELAYKYLPNEHVKHSAGITHFLIKLMNTVVSKESYKKIMSFYGKL